MAQQPQPPQYSSQQEQEQQQQQQEQQRRQQLQQQCQQCLADDPYFGELDVCATIRSPPVREETEPQPFNSNITAAVIAIIFCFPVGIFAMVKSFEAKSRWKDGNEAGARRSAYYACQFSMIAVCASVALWSFAVILHMLLTKRVFDAVDTLSEKMKTN